MIGVAVNLLSLYLGVGLVFALVFSLRGLVRVDPIVRGSTNGFRILIFPGCVMLWPILLSKWVRA